MAMLFWGALTAFALAADDWYPISGDGTGRDGISSSMDQRQQLLESLEDPNDTILLRALRQEYRERESTYYLSGFVQVWKGEQFHMTAEKAIYNHFTEEMVAEGDVVIQLGEDQIIGDRVTLNIRDQTGVIENCRAYLTPSIYLEAKEMRLLPPNPKTGNQRLAVRKATFTSCAFNPTADWSITAVEGYAEIDRQLTVYHSLFKVWKIPFFYFPYWTHPLRSDRTTGLLLPKVGTSGHAGFYIRNQFFWAISPYADATLGWDVSQRAGGAQRLELRYNLDDTSAGNVLQVNRLESSYPVDSEVSIASQSENSEVYEVFYYHNQTFRPDFRFQVLANYRNQLFLGDDTSSLNFYEQNSRAEARLTRQWNSDLRTAVELRSENYLQTTAEADVFLLPRFTLDFTDYRFGRSQFYFDLDFSADYARQRTLTISGDEEEELEAGLFRAYTKAEFKYQFVELPWMELTPRLGVRSAYYNERKGEAPADATGGTWLYNSPGVESEFDDYHTLSGIQPMGDGIRRDQYYIQATFEGPVLQRVFTLGGTMEKMQHIIEPQVDYLYEPQVGRTDAVDIGYDFPFIAERNLMRFSLTNRLTGKFRRGKGKDGKPAYEKREFLRLRVSQDYDIRLDRQRSDLGPPQTRSAEPLSYTTFDLDISPSRDFFVNVDAALDPLIFEFDQYRVGAGYYRPRLEIAGYATWTRKETLLNGGDESLATASLGLKVVPVKQLSLELSHTYNVTEALTQYAGALVTYKRQCWGLTLAATYKERQILGAAIDEDAIERDIAYEFSFHLRNIGDVGSANIERYGRR